MEFSETFDREITNYVAELEKHPDIVKLINAYIEKADINLFLNCNYLIYYEYSSFYLLNSAYSKKHRIVKLPKLIATIKQQEDYLAKRYYESNSNCQTTLLKQKKDTFDILVEIITLKHSFESDAHAIFAVYKLSWKLAMDRFMKISIFKYEPIFPDIDNLSLNQCVERYLDVDLIDPMNETNIGLLAYFMIHHKKADSAKTLLDVIEAIHFVISDYKHRQKLNKYETILMNNTQVTNIFTINDVDLMTGLEFEDFIVNIFNKMGYETSKTPATGDQGIDIIAEKHGIKIGIQAKCYSKNVTNSAIQEVTAGVKHYRCDKAIVATNNVFTKSAIQLAYSNNVVLWDRVILKEKILDYIQGS
jgi:Holliday junction resolvase-like predicted endonuclease